jgi:hypothetical protein
MPILRRKPPAEADAAVDRARALPGLAAPRGARPEASSASQPVSLPIYVMHPPGPEPLAATELGWRYVESAQPSPLEVWTVGDGRYEFAAAGTSRARARLEAALARATALAEADERTSELRLLVVSDAYLELVWVHYAGDDASDRLFLASRCPWLDRPAGQPMSLAELNELLVNMPGLWNP